MWNVQTFTELPSTQTLARDLLASGSAKHGDVFVALHQSGGRGQYENRTWHDEPGTNLLLSLVLTEVEPSVIDLMQFVTGLSVVSTLRTLLEQRLYRFENDRIRLKWPNDVLLDGKKICGILSEASWVGQTLKGLVIGIGLNVNQELFDSTIAARATSLRNVLGDIVKLEDIRDLLLATLQYTLLAYTDRAKLLGDIRTELGWMSNLEHVSAQQPDGNVLEAIRILGVNERGALHISSADGVNMTLDSATLSYDG